MLISLDHIDKRHTDSVIIIGHENVQYELRYMGKQPIINSRMYLFGSCAIHTVD